MKNRWCMRRCGFKMTLSSLGVFGGCLPSSAWAHVKWFAAYDVADQPRALADVCSSAFFHLVVWSVLALWLGSLIERTALGETLLRSIDRLCSAFQPRTEDLFRAATAIFFTALWAIGGIILTPELKTQSPLIPWLQAAIAIGMFWRSTLVLSAMGIVALFAVGIASYGTFHMMDYPIFLGLAAYLALTGLQKKLFHLRPLDVARWGAGITLMWASVEKWAYPDWTYPLLQTHAKLTMGLDPSFYMTAAGVVEFALAFSLVWTPLVRRIGAIALAAMFTSAVLEFGKIDAIGHLMIVVILLAVIVDDEVPVARRPPLLAPACYCAALIAFIALYYGTHAIIFGTAHT